MTINSEVSDIFYDIRSARDFEVPELIESLLKDKAFYKIAKPVVETFATWDGFTENLRNCKTVHDFQGFTVRPLLNKFVRDNTTTGLEAKKWSNIGDGNGRIFISNHRDIVLDAGFLNILLYEKGMNTTEIAIGDNLLIFPWITTFVRLNKSFIVKRSVSFRQMLETSTHLSNYIEDTIVNRNQSIWIAQREGRTKDSDDKTQNNLLKMLTLFDGSHPKDALEKLNITPVAISYEYDPCDYLKAKEFQLKRDHADYKKSQADDIENMVTGIRGFKGKVIFQFGESINAQLKETSSETDRSSLLTMAADMIDREIYKNYQFFKNNYIAYDLMTNEKRFASKYSETEKQKFEEYVSSQVEKINIEKKDIQFLRGKLIEMYGNTLKNYVETIA